MTIFELVYQAMFWHLLVSPSQWN